MGGPFPDPPLPARSQAVVGESSTPLLPVNDPCSGGPTCQRATGTTVVPREAGRASQPGHDLHQRDRKRTAESRAEHGKSPCSRTGCDAAGAPLRPAATAPSGSSSRTPSETCAPADVGHDGGARNHAPPRLARAADLWLSPLCGYLKNVVFRLLVNCSQKSWFRDAPVATGPDLGTKKHTYAGKPPALGTNAFG